MTRVFVATGVVLAVLLTGVVLWGRDRTPSPTHTVEDSPELTPSGDAQSASTRSQEGLVREEANPEPPEPPYAKLPSCFAMVPGGATGRLGYYDQKTDAYYAWKGVVLKAEQIPGITGWFASSPFDIRVLKVTEVDPPPAYYMPLLDGGFAPGFYDGRFTNRFFRWKGVRVTRGQISADAFKKYVLADGLVKYPHIIDPPQFARK